MTNKISDGDSFVPWFPDLDTIPEEIAVESVVFGFDRCNGLRILLDLDGPDGGRDLELTFSQIVSLQLAEEGNLSTIWNSPRRPLFGLSLSLSSDWLDILDGLSGGLLAIEGGHIHYSIVTYDNCIDILSRVTPDHKFLDVSRAEKQRRWAHAE